MQNLKSELVGSNASISFTIKNKSFKFPTKVKEVNGQVIVVDPIKIKGKYLNLTTTKIKISLYIDRKNARPIIFPNCNVKMTKKGAISYEFYPKTPFKEVNRRNGVRIPISTSGDALIGANNKSRPIYVKDVSIEGIGILVDNNQLNYLKDIMTLMDSPVRISFNDNLINYRLILEGEVSRICPVGNDKTLLGIRFSRTYLRLGQYISIRQRLESFKKQYGNSREYTKLLELTKKKPLTTIV